MYVYVIYIYVHVFNLVASERVLPVLRSRFGVLRSRTRFTRSRFESRSVVVPLVHLNVLLITCLLRLLRSGFAFWAPRSLKFDFIQNELLHLSVG